MKFNTLGAVGILALAGLFFALAAVMSDASGATWPARSVDDKAQADFVGHPEQGAPFTKLQIEDIREGFAKGISLPDVQRIMARPISVTWGYWSNSGTIPILVHQWADKYGHVVVGHFNRDGLLVYCTFDVKSFTPE
jgi:hypothetical protein